MWEPDPVRDIRVRPVRRGQPLVVVVGPAVLVRGISGVLSPSTAAPARSRVRGRPSRLPATGAGHRRERARSTHTRTRACRPAAADRGRTVGCRRRRPRADSRRVRVGTPSQRGHRPKRVGTATDGRSPASRRRRPTVWPDRRRGTVSRRTPRRRDTGAHRPSRRLGRTPPAWSGAPVLSVVSPPGTSLPVVRRQTVSTTP